MDLMLHVFPCVPNDAKFPGWSGLNDPAALLKSEQFPASEIDETLDDGDYRFVVYDIPGEESIPRINLSALPVLEGMGAEVVANVAVVDVDLPNHARWLDLAEATAHVEELLEQGGDLLDGAAVYTTRAGYRLLWRLTDPIPVSKYRSLMRKLMARLKADHGVDSDPSSDEWNRLFRMPACLRDGVVLETSAYLDALDSEALDPYQFGELEVEDCAGEVAGDHPEPLDDLSLDVWKAAYKHPYLKRGLPFPPDDGGSTYGTMRRAIASLAHEGPVTDPEHLFAMAHKSVEATPGRTLQEAWKMCVWTASRQQGASLKPPAIEERPLKPEPVEAGEWDEWFRVVDKRSSSTLNRLRAGLPFTPKTQAESKLLTAVFALATKLRITKAGDLYRLFYPSAQASRVDPIKLWEQCEQSAAQALEKEEGASTDEKMAAIYTQDLPLTIAIPGTSVLYQLDLREETSPTYQLTDKSCLLMHHATYTAPNLPFDAPYSDSSKTRSIDQLLLEYGNSATKVRYVTGQRGASFVPNYEGNALEIGVHALHPQLVPTFHQEVQDWLTLFGGSDPERFLDWLAVSTLTRFPVCAMYIHGLPGSGKSMLLQGLAAMWGGSPVPFANVSADFNESLLVSPIIAADEGVPTDRGDLSEVFRNLVANSTHDIRIKFQANATLHACMRLIITANELDALEFKKTLSGRSLQAIVERVLFIEQGQEPVEFLKNLGGRSATALWAERGPGIPGLIAEHVAWLRENREVKSSGRFLVEGVLSTWHKQFIGQQGIKPDVIKVIALAAKQAARFEKDGTGQSLPGVQVRASKSSVLITKEAVATQWALHGRGDPPRERVLAKTLGQLDEKDRVGISRPRIGRGNPAWGSPAIAISFDTLVSSEYVTLARLTDSGDE